MLKTYLQENQFIVPSYQYYGGLAGYQDYGILGFQIKNKLVNSWRNFFLGEDIHEVELPTIMPHAVLEASGHVERFTDYVVYDAFGMCHRADHYAKKWFDNHKMLELSNLVDSWDLETLEKNMNKYRMMDVEYTKKMLIDNNVVSHIIDMVETWDEKNLLTSNMMYYGLSAYKIMVLKKNLMFEVPSNTLVQEAKTDFLRPELAQGIFVNFNSYQNFLQQHNDAIFKPFGIAQVGKSYRKEISPQPFVRMREFIQAEIEFFVDPINKTHNNIKKYQDVIIPLLSDAMQECGAVVPQRFSIRDALEKNIISHELMAYFLAKIYLFAIKSGLKDALIRFRQHQKNEMSHYASQCWDLECLIGDTNSSQWLECVGCADRGSYDLTSHTNSNPKQPLNAKRKLKVPIFTSEIIIKPNMASLAKKYNKNANNIKTYFMNLNQELAIQMVESIKNNATFVCVIDQEYTFESSMFNIEEKKNVITHEFFTPHVIEPSFGIDRLMYAILEQNIWQRKSDERKIVLSLPTELTLYDIAVFPLHKKDKMTELANEIRIKLIANGLKCYTDDSSTAIGKRYVRCDEIGVRNVITVDPGSLETGLVTIRDRDTMNQIAVHYNDILSNLS